MDYLSYLDKMTPALEGGTFKFSSKILNEDGEPMLIALITDAIITKNKLKQVTNPIMFDRNQAPTSDGLFSETIFGTSADEQRRTCAYIELHEKFFHPYIYEVLKFLMRNIDKCCAGEGVWKIDAAGKLVEVKSEEDPDYDADHTGMTWLIENFHKLKFEETSSLIRKERIKLLKSLTDNEIFITKWLVIPRFFRDVEISNGRQSIPELNYDYNKLIQYTNSLKDDLFSFYNNKARYSVQMILYKLRKYGQSLVEKKRGAFHQMLLGKSTTFGSRDVISVAVMNQQRPEDNPVDIYHSGVPLAKCIVIGYPFISRYCINFFKDNFSGSGSGMIRTDIDGEFKPVEDANLADQTQIYTKAYIDKKMQEYMNTPATRFEPITVRGKNGKEYPIRLVGRYGPLDIASASATTIMDRPMTWTDLFYLAAMETISDKHVYITRYPLTDYSGTFPSLCMPLSTVQTAPAYINGKFYKHYPLIKTNLSTEEISTQFIDTLTMSNLFLSALGGDYDGDQCSLKLVFLNESNEEAHRIMHSPMNFISIEGNIIRDVGNEAYQCFYNMTKYAN